MGVGSEPSTHIGICKTTIGNIIVLRQDIYSKTCRMLTHVTRQHLYRKGFWFRTVLRVLFKAS